MSIIYALCHSPLIAGQPPRSAQTAHVVFAASKNKPRQRLKRPQLKIRSQLSAQVGTHNLPDKAITCLNNYFDKMQEYKESFEKFNAYVKSTQNVSTKKELLRFIRLIESFSLNFSDSEIIAFENTTNDAFKVSKQELLTRCNMPTHVEGNKATQALEKNPHAIKALEDSIQSLKIHTLGQLLMHL